MAEGETNQTTAEQTDLVYEALQAGDYTRSGSMQREYDIVQLNRVYFMWMLGKILTLKHTYCYSYE